MATLVTVTVQSSGGDYTSLSAAESGQQAIRSDLVTRDEQLDIACYAMEDTTAVTVDGYTTDITRYIRIYTPAGERHTGKWDTTKYRLVAGLTVPVLAIREDHVRVEGVQIHQTSNVDSGWGVSFDITTGRSWVSHCIVRGPAGTGFTNRGLRLRGNALSFCWNTVVYGFTGGNSTGIDKSANNARVYNCTVYNCAQGFANSDDGANMVVKNCVAAACGDGFVAGWSWPAAADYNASDLASDAPGTNSRNSQTFSFVDTAPGDFHLTGSDAGARNYGTDLSADADLAFSDDIDGQTRSGSWDIGADEYVAAGGGSLLLRRDPMAHMLVR